MPEEYSKYYAYSQARKGYSGVAVWTKLKPLNVQEGIGIERHDQEGRVLTLEYSDYFLVSVYVPNAGQGLKRHSYRVTDWDISFQQFVCDLKKDKPVIINGDLNVAHREIDIYNPKGKDKHAGYTPEERQNFSNLLEAGFVDTFRHFHPNK